eukprot:1569603-Pyramimonas_sp.AAC.1
MPPEDVLRSALDRQATREAERIKAQEEVDNLTADLAAAQAKLDGIKQQLVESESEVAQARLANAAAPLPADAATS